jgi:mRNA interferase MazF
VQCTRRSTGAPTLGAKSLTSDAFEPDEGDLIWTDFDPPTGRVQGGRRPALVISPVAFWRASRFTIVCPIMSRVRPFGTSVVLPSGLPVAGEILTGHVRSIDTVSRPIVSLNCRVPAPVLFDVRAKLAALLGFSG